MIYAPPFVFRPEGAPALRGDPCFVFYPERDPTPPFSPSSPLCNILSINHLERAKTLLPRAYSRSR